MTSEKGRASTRPLDDPSDEVSLPYGDDEFLRRLHEQLAKRQRRQDQHAAMRAEFAQRRAAAKERLHNARLRGAR